MNETINNALKNVLAAYAEILANAQVEIEKLNSEVETAKTAISTIKEIMEDDADMCDAEPGQHTNGVFTTTDPLSEHRPVPEDCIALHVGGVEFILEKDKLDNSTTRNLIGSLIALMPPYVKSISAEEIHAASKKLPGSTKMVSTIHAHVYSGVKSKTYTKPALRDGEQGFYVACNQ